MNHAPMLVKMVVPTELAPGFAEATGARVTFNGFPGVWGTVARAEVVKDGLLEIDIEIDGESQAAYLLRRSALAGLSAG